jgi:hypothetical protein
MKTKTLILIATLTLTLFTGCATLPDGSTDVEKTLRRVGNAAELAAYTGTTLHLADNPTDRPKFEIAVRALDALSNTNNFDPAALAAVLQSLPIRELQDPKAKIIIGSAIMLYEFELKELIPVEQPLYVAAVLQRVRNGLRRGLDATPQ